MIPHTELQGLWLKFPGKFSLIIQQMGGNISQSLGNLVRYLRVISFIEHHLNQLFFHFLTFYVLFEHLVFLYFGVLDFLVDLVCYQAFQPRCSLWYFSSSELVVIKIRMRNLINITMSPNSKSSKNVHLRGRRIPTWRDRWKQGMSMVAMLVLWALFPTR